ncbi:hypothetical protein JZ751_008360 [Albula glossodonta]|uniref:Pleiotrophin n=1 Tax=Albula glossodonta TaxID=121402 RepID=A0A8T2MUE9_9TELE|nr:hypothetical protein JZ751_008360 [Albula glossodonta]
MNSPAGCTFAVIRAQWSIWVASGGRYANVVPLKPTALPAIKSRVVPPFRRSAGERAGEKRCHSQLRSSAHGSGAASSPTGSLSIFQPGAPGSEQCQELSQHPSLLPLQGKPGCIHMLWKAMLWGCGKTPLGRPFPFDSVCRRWPLLAAFIDDDVMLSLQPCMVAVMAALVLTAAAGEGGKTEKQGKKERKSDCGEWQWSVCVANVGDCGLGTREGTRGGTDCKQTIKTQRCKIPCNWKKQFGGECKYDFQAWGECDMATGKKNRTGVLKKALMDATCPSTVSATKPCGKITKTKLPGKRAPTDQRRGAAVRPKI